MAAINIIPIEINQEHIRLCDLLKLAGLADSGARGKHMVSEGTVKVDGQPESRKTAKIRAGQTVQFEDQQIVVTAAVV
jgi:ribosome-associated protein